MFRNRIKLKDGSAFSRIALLRRHPSIEQKSAYDLSVAIHKATSFKRVSDALRLSLSQTQSQFIKSGLQAQGCYDRLLNFVKITTFSLFGTK